MEEVSDSQEAIQTMQTDLHEKGALLSKVWSDLFSLFTKYQAELFVRENSINVAEKQMEYQKTKFREMKADLDQAPNSDELLRLQEELNSKELAVSKFKIELTTTNNMLQRVQNDLVSHQDWLEKTRTESLQKENRLARIQMDNEKYKLELNVKDDQIIVKDRLLRKIQDEMRRENDEFKDRVRQLEEVLDAERKAHSATRRRLQSKSATNSQVIEIADSPPPTLDMSVDNQEYAISSIMSLADTQRNNSYGSQKNSALLNSSPYQRNISRSPQIGQRKTTVTLQNRTFNPSPQSKAWKMPNSLEHSISASSSNSESFPTLNDQIDTSQMNLGDMDVEQSDLSLGQGIESNTSPIPISGPIPSGSLPDMMQPGTSGGVKVEDSAEFQGSSLVNHPGTNNLQQYVTSLKQTMQGFPCDVCGKIFKWRKNMRDHRKKHFFGCIACQLCDKTFYRQDHLDSHMITHVRQNYGATTSKQ